MSKYASIVESMGDVHGATSTHLECSDKKRCHMLSCFLTVAVVFKIFCSVLACMHACANASYAHIQWPCSAMQRRELLKSGGACIGAILTWYRTLVTTWHSMEMDREQHMESPTTCVVPAAQHGHIQERIYRMPSVLYCRNEQWKALLRWCRGAGAMTSDRNYGNGDCEHRHTHYTLQGTRHADTWI
jgi:hypothetical protein